MYKKVKKQNGERFAKVLRDYHNGILEIPGILRILKHAGSEPKDAEHILPYLLTLLNTEEVEEEEKAADPYALLEEAGYHAEYADTLKKQNAIKKYFTAEEELCTFRDRKRFKHYYIVNCVRHDVDSIKREDFLGKEKRQDTYGTSVISIQMAKRGGYISIKNRYNHTVSGCDNTFKSNPDNIIEGLSKALQNEFDIPTDTKIISNSPSGYALVDSRLVKNNYEVNGIVYGDHCIVQRGELREMKEHEYLFDYFIFNARTKTFSCIGDVADSFIDTFNEAYGGSPTVYVKKHCIYDGDVLLVGV